MSQGESPSVQKTVEAKSATEYLVRVEIPADAVEQKLEESYRKADREIELPGFRRGRVPRGLLEARFGRDFLYEDVQQELIREILPTVLEEEKLNPVSTPKTEIKQFEIGKPFQFEVSLEVLPPPVVKDYFGIEVTEPPLQPVTQEEIDREIEELQLEHATLVPKGSQTAAVEVEDVVEIRESGKRDTHEVQARLKYFSEGLIGHRVGETVELPLGQKREPVEIAAIRCIERPELPDLAKTLGHETVEELQASVRKDLEALHEREQRSRLKRAILDTIVDRSEVPIPQRLVDELAQAEVQQVVRNGGRKPSDEELTKLKEAIVKRLKRQRVLETIEEKENLKISDADFEAFLKAEAERQQMNPIKFKALLERERRLDQLRSVRDEERALDLLLENAKIVKSSEKLAEKE